MKKLSEIICGNPRCGKLFQQKRHNQKFCCEKCGFQARKPPKTQSKWGCGNPECTEKLTFDPFQRGRQKKYCSGECRRRAFKLRHAKTPKKEQLCENDNCGNFFFPNHINHLFCCERCRVESRPGQYMRKNRPLSTISDKDRLKRIDCTKYNNCLYDAARQNLKKMGCKDCRKYVKRSDASFYFLTDTYGKTREGIQHDFR